MQLASFPDLALDLYMIDLYLESLWDLSGVEFLPLSSADHEDDCLGVKRKSELIR